MRLIELFLTSKSKMGVRGLTTFIANRSDAYLRNYRLHDTYLVIDGNSLAANLYQLNRTRNDCFGGDYDKYEKTICRFFNALLKCNIIPLVILDGAYEKKKLRTVFERLKNKVKTFEKINSANQIYHKVFPLFVRELFVEVVLKLKIKIIRCDFEADYELACLARTLNCPVLSYDSDFFVYDVMYIPYITLGLIPQQVKNGFYLPCQLYEVEYFLKAYGGLNKSVMPLLAVLLGNDYINKNVFKDFYVTLKLTKRKKLQNAAQRSISSIIKWLQNETYESAILKILSKIPENKRRKVANSIKLIVEGYVCKKSSLLGDLNLNSEHLDKVDFVIDTDKYLKESKDVDSLDLDLQKSALDDSDEEEDEVDLNDIGSDEEISDFDSDIEEESGNETIPAWFKTNFRKCLYPTAFMDILVRNIYFCTPQLENYSNVCSHKICVQIIAAFNKILKGECSQPLVYVARHQVSNLKKYKTPSCNLELPTLNNLQCITQEQARNYVLKVLNFDNSFVNDLTNNIPERWQLYILAIMYWIKNAIPSVSYSHVYSLILCLLMVNKIEQQINNERHAAKFLSKYKDKLNRTGATEGFSCTTLKLITKDDFVKCNKSLLKYFKMEPKMRQSAKLYDRNILDCFAQFQSCLLHIKYLNVLLNAPFSNCILSEFYNGTFLYNMCSNLQKRSNINAYIDSLLHPCPTILKCFREVTNFILAFTSGHIYNIENKRKRRKRKRSAKLCASSDDADESEDTQNQEDNSLIDENNKFSLLNFL